VTDPKDGELLPRTPPELEEHAETTEDYESGKRPYLRLDTLRMVRKEMARVYRSVARNGMRPEEGTRRIYMLERIQKNIEAELTLGRTPTDDGTAKASEDDARGVSRARELIARIADGGFSDGGAVAGADRPVFPASVPAGPEGPGEPVAPGPVPGSPGEP
jgi:hypothetical protein